MNVKHYFKFLAFNSKKEERRQKFPLLCRLHYHERKEKDHKIPSYIRHITKHMVSTQYTYDEIGDSNIIMHLVYDSPPLSSHKRHLKPS